VESREKEFPRKANSGLTTEKNVTLIMLFNMKILLYIFAVHFERSTSSTGIKINIVKKKVSNSLKFLSSFELEPIKKLILKLFFHTLNLQKTHPS
jgi:hypothetical protein